MFALLRQIVLTVLFLAGVGYIVLVRDVAPAEPNFVPIILAGCLSFAVPFYLLVITIGIIRRTEWSVNKTKSDVAIELTKQWLLAIALFLSTILFYTFLFRMGGVPGDGGAAVTHEAPACLYYAIINWFTVGHANAASNAGGPTMRLIISMEALTGGLSTAALIAAIIAQVAAIFRSGKSAAS